MRFFAPQYLWLLAMAAPLIAAYFYRVRKRRLEVPYLPLWDEVVRREHRQFAFRRLTDLGQLATNVLLLVTVTFAMAEIQIDGVTRRPERHIVILDTSPSMQAENRRDRAFEYLEEYVRRSVGAGDEMTVLGTDGSVLSRGRDVRSCVDELRGRQPMIGPELGIRQVLIHAPNRDRLVILTDGQDPTTPPEAITFGTSVGNVAIIGGELLTQGDTISVQVRVANFSDMRRQVTVNLHGAQSVLELEPGAEKGILQTWPSRDVPQVIKVFLQEPDALALDDACYFVTHREEPISVAVLYESSVNPFLVIALGELVRDGVVQQVAAFPVDEADKVPQNCVVILDHVLRVPTLKSERALVLGATSPRRVDNPSIVQSIGNIEFSIRHAAVLELGPGAESLIQAREGAIAVFRRVGDHARVDVGFRLEDSDIQITPAFPLFLRWALEKLNTSRLFPTQAPLGQAIRNTFPIDGSSMDVLFADRSSTTFKVAVRDGWVQVSNRVSPGVFRITAGRSEESVASNWFDPAESDIRPKVKHHAPPPEELPWTARIPLTSFAAAVAAVLSILEWALYNRSR